ncbi:MAG: transglutaminase domain-containing protein [Candidatus Dormibacteria bacterium]
MAAFGRRLTATLLAGGVIAATCWAVLAGGWVNGAGGAVAVSLAGLSEAGVVAWRRTPRWAAAAAAPLLLGAALVPLTLGTMPGDGDSSTGHVLVRYADALKGGLFEGPDWPFLVGLSGVLWVCAYWMGWCAFRKRRGVLATLPCYTVLAVNALNAPSLGRVAIPETVAAALCLLLVAEVELDRLAARWRARTVIVMPGVRSRFAVSMTLGTAAVIGLSALIPPITNRDISAVLFAAHVRPPQAGMDSPAATPPAGGASVGFSRSTRPGGPLVSRPRPALVYSTDSPDPAYLRLVNDTIFTAGNWFPAAPPGARAQAGGGAVVTTATTTSDGFIIRDREPAHGGVSVSQRAVHAVVTASSPSAEDSGFVPFIGEPEATSGAGRAIELGLAAGRGAPLLTVDQVTPLSPSAGGETSSTGLVSTAAEELLKAAGTAYPSFTADLRSLSDDASGGAAVIRALALEWVRGAGDPYDQARAIEQHLRDPHNFTYDLRPPGAPDGVWPIVHFLTVAHRGYCQYFASSMGALLRSLNIPARLVNGYGPGAVAERGRDGVSVHTLTTSDAHTWVEAYFPHYGWIPFEPTPPSSLGDYQPPPRGAVADRPSATPSSTPAASPSAQATPTPGARAPAKTPPPPPPAPAPPSPPPLWVVVPPVALLLAAVTLAWWMMPATLAGLWRRVLIAGRLTGSRRQPSETDTGYVRRLAAALSAGPPGLSTALMGIAAVSGKAQFSAAGLLPGDDERWQRCWRSGRGALLRVMAGAIARRLRRRG